jgi:integrase
MPRIQRGPVTLRVYPVHSEIAFSPGALAASEPASESSNAARSSLPCSSCDTVPTATPSIAGTKRGIVPKRRFQKGTFVKRGNNWVGMWRVDTLQPSDGTVRREQRSQTFVGLSERAARAAFQPILDGVNAANQATPPVPKTSDTVAKAVAEWREHAAATLKPSSRRSADSHLRRHILPLLGECPLTELTVKRMQTFATSLTSGQRTAKTIENVLLTLSSILASARKWGYKVPEVALSDLSLPRKVKAKPRCYTADEMTRIVSSAEEPLSTICFVLCATGMRIGEVLALRTEDLDFTRRLIHVRSSVYAGTLGTPKSYASIASLPMPPVLATRLKSFLASKHYRQNDFRLLFANRRGRPFSANKLREKKLRPLLTSLGISLAGFHAFRHGVATTLIDRGASITTVGAQLRHSDPRITLGLYAHVVPQSQREAVDGLAQLLTEPRIADSAQVKSSVS